MGAACCRPAAADDGRDSGDAIKKHARGNGAAAAARRGEREAKKFDARSFFSIVVRTFTLILLLLLLPL